MKNLKIISIIGFVFISVSCTNNSRQISSVTNGSTDDTNTIKSVSDQVNYILPSPEEIMQVIAETDINFFSELLSPNRRTELFTKQTAINLNIGIYLADLSYCSLFEKHNETLQYMDLISQLSNRIYLTPDLKSKLEEVRKKDINMRETSDSLTKKIFYELINDLESSGQQKTVAVICAGAYIESLYLSLESFEQYDYKNPLFYKLAEQKYAINNLLAYMKRFEKEDDIKELVALLNPVESIYNQMPFTDKTIKISRNADSTLLISGGKVFRMDETTYSLLKSEIIKIRMNLLNYR